MYDAVCRTTLDTPGLPKKRTNCTRNTTNCNIVNNRINEIIQAKLNFMITDNYEQEKKVRYEILTKLNNSKRIKTVKKRQSGHVYQYDQWE